jgi:putative endonuclease
MPAPTTDRGAKAEARARRHLEKQGLRCLASNFRTRWGELDLVMEQGRQLVFVEVRYRRNTHFGGAIASVTAAKQARLIKAASQFLDQHRLGHRPVRFDIVAIDGAAAELEWLVDAFRPEA